MKKKKKYSLKFIGENEKSGLVPVNKNISLLSFDQKCTDTNYGTLLFISLSYYSMLCIIFDESILLLFFYFVFFLTFRPYVLNIQ